MSLLGDFEIFYDFLRFEDVKTGLLLPHRKNGNLCISIEDGMLPISLLYIAILSANMQGAGTLIESGQL